MIILKKSEGKVPRTLPDGFENLSDYNLVTYKSLREPLDDWTLDELIGYYFPQTSQSVFQKMITH